MSRWGKPIKNNKHRDPRYFLNENIELEEQAEENPNRPTDEKVRVERARFNRALDGIKDAIRSFVEETYEADPRSVDTTMDFVLRDENALRQMANFISKIKDKPMSNQLARERGQ